MNNLVAVYQTNDSNKNSDEKKVGCLTTNKWESEKIQNHYTIRPEKILKILKQFIK